MQTKRRNLLYGGMGIIAAAMAVASVAYACTTFRGNMTITGDTAVTTTGKNSGMNWCGDTTPARVSVSRSTGFTVGVATSTSCGSQGLGTTVANINYFKTSNTTASDLNTDCMNGAGNGTLITTISIASNAGSKSIAASSVPSTVGDYKICVAKVDNSQGMMHLVNVY